MFINYSIIFGCNTFTTILPERSIEMVNKAAPEKFMKYFPNVFHQKGQNYPNGIFP